MVLWMLGMVLLYSFQSLFCRLYTQAREGRGAIQFSVFYAAFVGACTLAVNGFSYRPSTATLLLGLANAVVILLYNVAMVKCGHLGSYAFMMICTMAGGILVPMVYDMIYLRTALGPVQLAAVALMLASFVAMNLDGVTAKKNGRYLMWCGVLFLVNGLYTVFMNLQQTMMAFTQRNEMIITTFLGMAVLTAAFELAFARRAFVGEFRMSRRAWGFMLLSSLSAMLAVNLLMLAMQHVNITVLSVVNNGGVLAASALYAFTLFREKPTAASLSGVATACVSIVMLSL